MIVLFIVCLNVFQSYAVAILEPESRNFVGKQKSRSVAVYRNIVFVFEIENYLFFAVVVIRKPDIFLVANAPPSV